MIISRPHNAVYQIPLVRQQKKALRFPVQTSHRINPHRIIQILGNCDFLSLLFRAADNPPRLIKQKKYLFLLRLNGLSIQTDRRVAGSFFSGDRHPPVNRDSPGDRQPVRLSPGPDARAAEIFIDSDHFCTICICPFFVHCSIIYFFPFIRNKQITGRVVFLCRILYTLANIFYCRSS